MMGLPMCCGLADVLRPPCSRVSMTAADNFTLPDLGGKWFGTFGGSDELIDQAGMGFRVQESELSEVIE